MSPATRCAGTKVRQKTLQIFEKHFTVLDHSSPTIPEIHPSAIREKHHFQVFEVDLDPKYYFSDSEVLIFALVGFEVFDFIRYPRLSRYDGNGNAVLKLKEDAGMQNPW